MDEREELLLSETPEEEALPAFPEICGDDTCSEPVLSDPEMAVEPEAEPEEALAFLCPCCGRKGFSHEPDGSWDICPVCGWEDDPVQLRDPDFAGGANELSLNQARAQFLEKNAGEGQIL